MQTLKCLKTLLASRGWNLCISVEADIETALKDNPNSVPQRAFKSVCTHFRVGTQIPAAYCTTILLKCMQKSVQAQLSPLKTGESMEYQILCLGDSYFMSFMLIAFLIGINGQSLAYIV